MRARNVRTFYAWAWTLTLLAFSMLGWMAAPVTSANAAGLSCFDGPHLDHEDRTYSYWSYTNNCSGTVIINYSIKAADGTTETGTTSIGACREGSIVDSKGQYQFDIRSTAISRWPTCASKTGSSDADAGDDSGAGRKAAPAQPDKSRRPVHADDLSLDADDSMHQGSNADDAADSGQKLSEQLIRQFGTVPSANKCWRQKQSGNAWLICCSSMQICEGTCLEVLKSNPKNACPAACAGAAESTPPGMNCYWAH